VTGVDLETNVDSRDWSKGLAEIARSRRHPSRWRDFDYLHVRYLVDNLRRAIDAVDPPPRDVLDIWCGSRAYDDLLPTRARSIGLDVTNDYGLADVVTEEYLPFDDESFDMVMKIEAFQYAPDPTAAVAEMKRVLRPGGTAIVTTPFAWEYVRESQEHRFTESQMRKLFADWASVEVIENGGIAVTWATITNALVQRIANRAPDSLRPLADIAVQPVFATVSTLAALLERRGAGGRTSTLTLPMNLMVVARTHA
jgi:SAM-dependent methyltransferase